MESVVIAVAGNPSHNTSSASSPASTEVDAWLGEPVFLPCYSCIATSLLDVGSRREERQNCPSCFIFYFSLKHGVYRRTGVEE